MPTLPPSPQPQPLPPDPRPHSFRQVAESFGVDPERYDRTRQPYPAALVERVAAASPGPDLLDVGCGTGIAARQFQAAGCRVLGVEPDARMADFARRAGTPADVARFEDWDPAERTFDAVIAGTAWHWVDPVAGAAKAARVLRQGGLLAAFWHAFQLPPQVAEALAAAYQRVAPGSPFSFPASRAPLEAYQSLIEIAADGIRQAGRFGEPERWRFDWERTYTRQEWLDQLPTTGPMTQLPPEQLTEVTDATGAAIDALGGSFTMSYSTVAVAATALPGKP